jgi:hypothetical protein
MSSPGWMPSRPRPLGQARRGLVSYASPYLRRRARRVPAATTTAAAPGPRGPAPQRKWFSDRRAKLPVATLLPRQDARGSRVWTGWAHRWVSQRWRWVQPRLIPLIAAFVGLVGVLNARRYLLELARGPAVVCVELAGASAEHPAPRRATPPTGEAGCRSQLAGAR